MRIGLYACLLAMFAGCVAPESRPGFERRSAAQHALGVRQGAEEDLADLEATVASRYQALLEALDEEGRGREHANAKAVGSSGRRLAVEWSQRGNVRSVWTWRMRVPTPVSAGAAPVARATAFLAAHPRLFGLSQPSAALQLRAERPAQGGGAVLRFDQVMFGLPVFGADLLVHFDRELNLDWMAGLLVPETDVIAAAPAIAAEAAAAAVGGDATTAVLATVYSRSKLSQ